MVGAVIIHNGKIIVRGYHHKSGESHAEINAINSVKNPELLKESDIYVSLRPCTHFGKTHLCLETEKNSISKKVLIGTLDTHEKVNGKSIKILTESGIDVQCEILEKKSQHLNKRFSLFIKRKDLFLS